MAGCMSFDIVFQLSCWSTNSALASRLLKSKLIITYESSTPPDYKLILLHIYSHFNIQSTLQISIQCSRSRYSIYIILCYSKLFIYTFPNFQSIYLFYFYFNFLYYQNKTIFIQIYSISLFSQNYTFLYYYIANIVRRMEEQQTVPVTVTFEPQTTNKDSINTKADIQNMAKHNSEPKFRTYKQQILKIPKVKQILNKDRYVFSQDIEKRLQLIGSLKNDGYEMQEMSNLCDLRKKADTASKDKKKNKRHKTNFKIPLTRKNVESLNNLIVKHISHNQKYKNEEVIFLKQYSENAPFDLKQLEFIDKLDQVKNRFSEKYPELNKKVLSKNKLTLENVILNRNIRRQIKLDNKKQEKLHAINVFSTLNHEKPNLLLKKSTKKAQQQK